jgi:hypothetical protein
MRLSLLKGEHAASSGECVAGNPVWGLEINGC